MSQNYLVWGVSNLIVQSAKNAAGVRGEGGQLQWEGPGRPLANLPDVGVPVGRIARSRPGRVSGNVQ